MEPANIVLMVITGWCAILCILAGYLIRQNQSVDIISFPGQVAEKIRDKAGFSRFTGKRIMVLGLVALLTSLGIGLLPRFLMQVILLFILSIVVIITETAIHKKRYL